MARLGVQSRRQPRVLTEMESTADVVLIIEKVAALPKLAEKTAYAMAAA